MSKKTIAFLFLLIVSPVLVYFLWPTDESRIKKLVRECAKAVEKEDIDTLMLKISFTYQDDYGLSYILLKKLIEDGFRRFSDMEVEYESLKVVVDKENASAQFDVRVIASHGQERGYFMGDIKEPAHITLYLEKGPLGKWLIVKAEGYRGF